MQPSLKQKEKSFTSIILIIIYFFLFIING